MKVQYVGRKSRLVIKCAGLSQMYVVSKYDGPFELAEEDVAHVQKHYAHVIKPVEVKKASKKQAVKKAPLETINTLSK